MERPVWCGNGRPLNLSHLRQWKFYEEDNNFGFAQCYNGNLIPPTDGSKERINLSVDRYWCEITWGKNIE
jgi:hypothetical protein